MATTLHPAVTTPNLTTELDALLHGAGVAQLTDRAFLRITGADATRWLNGMVTNSIESLKLGEGNYNFLLNAQGRIQGDCTIYREPGDTNPAFLLETTASQIDTIQQLLDKFIIMDDVELQPATSNLQTLTILGPKAPKLVEQYYKSFRAGGRPDLTALRLSFFSESGDLTITLAAPLVPRIEIRTLNAAEITRNLLANGAIEISPEALEALRILEGTPLYGTDIRDKDLPQETAQTRALHFSKGCYLGQEIVERIHSRGAVHRTFTGFELTGALPPTGTPLTADSTPDSKPIGELTSVASIQLPTRATPIQLALGYIRREALDRNVPLQYPGGTATPITLPYQPSLTTYP